MRCLPSADFFYLRSRNIVSCQTLVFGVYSKDSNNHTDSNNRAAWTFSDFDNLTGKKNIYCLFILENYLNSQLQKLKIIKKLFEKNL